MMEYPILMVGVLINDHRKFDFTEPLKLIRILHEKGVGLLTLPWEHLIITPMLIDL